MAIVINTIDSRTSKVLINSKIYNTKYSKYYKHSRKLLVDNNGFTVHPNDVVKITTTRPLSKNKSWIITENQKTTATLILPDIIEKESE